MRKYRWQIPVFIVAIVLGLLISVQYKIQLQIVKNRQVVLDRNVALSEVLSRAVAIRNDHELEIQSLRKVIGLYEKMATEDANITPGLSEELDKLRMLNGKTKVEGPGILMTIDDRNAYDKITSSDLQDIVNVLRYSGAEAISINNQRIIANTPISEAGKNMLINKTPVNTNDGITYEIKVIGDSEKLERLVKITNNLVSDLIDLKGVKFSVIQEKEVVIPAYLGGYIYDYAKPASTAKK